MSDRTQFIMVWSIVALVCAVWGYFLYWSFSEIGRLIAEAWVGHV